MTQLTLDMRSRTTARILSDGEEVGHIGLMAGGSCAFVNVSRTFGEKFAFVAHATSCRDALAELVKILTKEGLL